MLLRKMLLRKAFYPVALAGLLAACQSGSGEQGVSGPTRHSASSNALEQNTAKVIPVTLVNRNGDYDIYRKGEPYFIRGAAGSHNMPFLKASGGNSVRTWSTDGAQEILDQAHELGMTVMLGLAMGHERHGFDYDDEAAVQAQKEAMREQVLKYKDHPALLAWGLGNEVDLMYTNTNVWYAVEDAAQMVQELDPNHLVTTVVAGIDKEKADLIKERVPSIDYLSINIYGGLEDMPQILAEAGYSGPYVITEWGPTGWWQVDRTAWDVPMEQTSTEKAASYRERYIGGIKNNPDKAMGSYVFFWDQKQETTPTWFGLFLETGQPTEVVDSMQYLWTGEWPEHRAPSIRSLRIDGKRAEDSVYLEPGEVYTAEVDAFHPQDEPYTVLWEFLPESTDIKNGGDFETRPQTIEGLVVNDDGNGTMRFMAPEKSGPYRLFVYVLSDENKAATANIPFYVR